MILPPHCPTPVGLFLCNTRGLSFVMSAEKSLALPLFHSCGITTTGNQLIQEGTMVLRQEIAFDTVDRWRQERMPFLSRAETRETFFARIAEFLPELDPRYQAIQKAYDTAKDAFRGVRRDSGERYFEHLRAVTLILIEYLEIRDYELIVAALLHDIVEDKPEWNIQRIRNEFGDRVALLVSFLSQPTDGEFGSQEEAERVFHERFEFAPRDFFIIKLPDRLHNLLTLKYRPKKKQVAKIEETLRYYLDHARKHLILLPELREVLYLLQAETS